MHPYAHHAIRHDVPHLGWLEVAAHHHAPVLHLLLGHKLDQPADHLRRRRNTGTYRFVESKVLFAKFNSGAI
jgi:hypothetical protein